jgi:hypothetical protein
MGVKSIVIGGSFRTIQGANRKPNATHQMAAEQPLDARDQAGVESAFSPQERCYAYF